MSMSMSSSKKDRPERFFCLGPTEHHHHHHHHHDGHVSDSSNVVVPLRKVKDIHEEDNTLDILKLEDTILSYMVQEDEDEEEDFLDDDDDDPKDTSSTLKPIVTDAQWLHCRRDPPATVYYYNHDNDDDNDDNDDDNNNQVEEVIIGKTVLGILEQQQQQQDRPSSVSMSIYTTSSPQQDTNLIVPAPHFHRKRQSLSYNHGTTPQQHQQQHQQQHIHLDWIDIRSWQQQQQQQQQFFLQTSSHICYFLRSLLGSSNEASPWCTTQEKEDSSTSLPDVVAIVMSTPRHPPHAKETPQDSPFQNFLNFHHGNACPSYYLHSTTQLQQQVNPNHNNDNDDDATAFTTTSPLWILQGPQSQHSTSASQQTPSPPAQQQEDTLLVVFRRLPPRDHLSSSLPPPHHSVFTSTASSSSSSLSSKISSYSSLTDGCLWEIYNPPKEQKGQEQPPPSTTTTVGPQLRMTGPPYIHWLEEECLSFLAPLLQPENLQMMQQEALKIPQWTAWPEKQHYSSTSSNQPQEEEQEESWTVFPLCHCFPSNCPENLKWISLTSQFVPHTTQLLQTCLGARLRTALFSKLLPNTVLEPHTGWEDLANHVYRLHIPLEVPPSADHPEDGFLCGTWVDGCVETHAVGTMICFDDSKVHRAFNYSSTHSRVVLIVDIERPSHLPVGTATGGHTEELDKFIDQLN